MPPTTPTLPKVPFWNVWWTIAVIAGALTVLVAILETLGIFGDTGLVLGTISLVVTILAGLAGASRSTVRELTTGLEMVYTSITEERRTLDATLTRIERLLDDRLPRRHIP